MQHLSPEQKQKVLDYIYTLQNGGLPLGEPGWRLLQHAREINFPVEDLEEMARAIEEEFGFKGWDKH